MPPLLVGPVARCWLLCKVVAKHMKHACFLSSKKTVLFLLMLTIVIELMGAFLVFPILPKLFISDHSRFLGAGISLEKREFYYSLSMLLWSVGTFFGAPLLGSLSDDIGRKRVLVLCLFATTISYLLGGISVLFGSIVLFFLSRLLLC